MKTRYIPAPNSADEASDFAAIMRHYKRFAR